MPRREEPLAGPGFMAEELERPQGLDLVEVGLERCLVGGAEGLITLLGVTLGPGGDREWSGWDGVGGWSAQQCPRHAWMSGGREAEKQEPQL